MNNSKNLFPEKIVKRGITEIVTPGIKSDEKLLDFNANNYLASIHFDTKGEWGIAFLDISTGEFLTSQGSKKSLKNLFRISALLRSFFEII